MEHAQTPRLASSAANKAQTAGGGDPRPAYIGGACPSGRGGSTVRGSTLGRGHRPRTRTRIQLRTPRHARLPQAIAPLRRQRVAFIVASIPVDDLIDLDGRSGPRDHEGIPHTGRRLRGLEMVEQRDLGSLTDPPDEQVAGLIHTYRDLPPRGPTIMHIQYTPRMSYIF